MNYQKVIARTIVAVVAFISTGIALVTLILALRAIEPLGFYAKCVCGVLFQNAYCNIPVSGASRASLLTGVYPRYPNRFISFSAYASKDCPEAIPISGWFTQNGYHTVSDGKVFHHMSDHADSWSEPPYRNHPDGYDVYWAEYNKWELWMNSESGKTINPKTMRGPFCESADVPDTAYDDGKLALVGCDCFA